MLPKDWLAMPVSKRKILAKKYNLVKTQGVKVQGDTVVSDGFSAEELLKIPMGNYPLKETGEAATTMLTKDERDTNALDTRVMNTVVTDRPTAGTVIIKETKVNDTPEPKKVKRSA